MVAAYGGSRIMSNRNTLRNSIAPPLAAEDAQRLASLYVACCASRLLILPGLSPDSPSARVRQPSSEFLFAIRLQWPRFVSEFGLLADIQSAV